MLTYSAFVWLGIAQSRVAQIVECGLFMLFFMLLYPLLSPSMQIVEPCHIGLVTVKCALVLCVVLVAIFGNCDM
jgi:hypothetical protein